MKRFLVLALGCVTAYSLAQETTPTSESGQLLATKWSGNLSVPDPVAISLDNQGRAYVTQTQRRKAQDLDIRQHREWIPVDVGLETVEQKKAFYHKILAPGKGKDSIKDYNGDGSHDYHDLMVLSDKIHRLEDTDGDGVADQIHVYAENFQTEVSGIGAGVLEHDGDVYLTIVPDVFRLQDTDGDGKADKREVIATGFGVHIAYAGHDMHGLTMGPDGMLYWSIGDKGLSVNSKEGKLFHYPNQGAVMRCNPDGSDFEVFAHGLRNVQEIAFDEFGNLFGVDNDADQPGEKERFVYIVRGMDAGWRCNYQYRGSDYNPWNSEGLSKPIEEFPNRPAYALPPICSYFDGPCGFAYNPGTALGKSWQRTFFMTGAPRGLQYAFQTEPNGASFKMVNSRQIGQGIPITGWNFGPDGGLYGSDWGLSGYPLNQSGAVWMFDVAQDDKHPLRGKTAELLKSDFKSKQNDELANLLDYADQRVGLKAQFELVKRKDDGRLLSAARTGKIHGVWGLGQLKNLQALESLADHENEEIQAQVARTVVKLDKFPESIIQTWVKSENLRVRFLGLQALAEHGTSQSIDLLVETIASNTNGQDLYIRHAGSMALVAMGADELAKLVDHDSVEVQLSAVLALRRLKSRHLEKFLNQLELIASEAAIAIHDDFSIPEAMPSLAKHLDTNPPNEALVRRAINANLRLGDEASAKRVAGYAANVSNDKKFREVAMNSLLQWIEPSEFDAVDGRIRNFKPRDPAAIGKSVELLINQLLTDRSPEIQSGAMQLAAIYGINLDRKALAKLVASEQSSEALRLSALGIIKDDETSLRIALKSKSSGLRILGLELIAKVDPDFAKQEAMQFLNSDRLREQQVAIKVLKGLKAKQAIVPLVEKLVAGDLSHGLKLEVIEAGQALGLDYGLNKIVSSKADPLDPKSFDHCIEGGSVTKGEEIFRTHIAAQCVRCHKVNNKKGGSIIGPNLKNIGAKDASYVLEGLIAPQKTIAKGYGNITITRKDGSVVAGQFRQETSKHIVVRDSVSKKETKVAKSTIQERSEVVSVMPPMGALLKQSELRDVMAYLMSLKEK